MKTTIFTLIALLTCAFSFAQTLNDWDKKVLDELINKSPYIFIGKPVSNKVFKTVDGGIAKSVILNVTEVIKGNINKGTVEIVFPCSGAIDSIHNIVIDNETLIPESYAIYFTTNAEEWALNSKIAKGWGLNSKIANSNNLTLGSYSILPFNTDNEITGKYYVLWGSFKKITEVYDYLEKNYGLKVDKSLYEKKSPKNTDVNKSIDLKKTNDIHYEQRAKKHKELLQFMQIKQQRNLSQNKALGGCSELFISEYLEGTAHNTALEFYNPSPNPIILNRYFVRVFMNGAPTPLIIQLNGTLAPKQTHVIVNPNASSAILAIANQTSHKINFNGDDAIQLVKVLNTININIDSIEGLGQNPHDILDTLQLDTLDQIGITNVYPGNNGWAVTPSGSTKNTDLRRKYSISIGDTSWASCKNEWNIFPSDSIQNLGQHLSFCSSDPYLNISFANPITIDSIGNQYFEFDIMASSTGANTYLDNTILDITYNSAAFGTNAVLNGTVTVNRGTNFNYSTYADPNLSLWDGQDSIGIIFTTNTDSSQTSWNRQLITSTPVQLLHVIFQVQNCNQNANIQFFNTSFTSFFSWYVANANDDPNNSANNISYDNVFYPSALNTTIPCGIQISDFTSPVNAGVGDILTITGYGFGNTRGNGKVKFINADNCCSTYIQKLNDIDYVPLSWTNTQIKIRVPYEVDSLVVNNVKSRIGSGNFIVKNSLGDSAISSNNLAGNPFKVYYSIQNTSFINNSIYKKYKVNLINDNINGGYTFRLDTGFNSNPAARGCIQKAIEDWKCVTGANIVLGTDTTLTYNPNDGVNNIFFTSTLDPWVNASTNQNFWLCPLSDNTYQSEFDILINNSINWQYDTTGASIQSGKYDFYGVMLHEIGHIVMLGHNNALNDLMYWQYSPGPLTPSQRVSLQQYTSPGDGGFYSVQSSSNIVYSGLCNVSVMLPQYSCNYSVKEIFGGVMNLNIYPNPTNYDFINVSYELKEHAKIKFITSDITGRIIDEMQPNNNNIGKHQEQINVDNLPSGIYFLILNINGKQQTNKFIKF